jgi:RimJ/RimL family protein N-acetyltransferase
MKRVPKTQKAMSLNTIDDEELIRATVTHPKIYPFVIDDGSPSAADYKPPMEGVIYVGAWDSDYLGLFCLWPQNSVTVECHLCLLPKARGPKALEAVQRLVQWVWENTGFLRITGSVPSFNRKVLALAKRAGFEEFGRNSQSFLRWGKLHDQILMGVSK